MDYYEEARWFFDAPGARVTWYNEVVQELLVKPRLPRFGVMQRTCTSLGGQTSKSNACDGIVSTRMAQNNTIALFSDIGVRLETTCSSVSGSVSP